MFNIGLYKSCSSKIKELPEADRINPAVLELLADSLSKQHNKRCLNIYEKIATNPRVVYKYVASLVEYKEYYKARQLCESMEHKGTGILRLLSDIYLHLNLVS